MNINEVMIGNLAMTPHDYITRITKIEDGVHIPCPDVQLEGWVKYFYIKDLKPIPLTVEMLKMFGFHPSTGGYARYFIDNEETYCIEFSDKGNFWFCVVPYFENPYDSAFIGDCQNLHQLQNFLNQVGKGDIAEKIATCIIENPKYLCKTIPTIS